MHVLDLQPLPSHLNSFLLLPWWEFARCGFHLTIYVSHSGTANLTGVTVPQYQYATAASQTGQSQIVLPSGGAMIHSPAAGIVGNPPQNIVGIQPTRLAVSGGMTLTPVCGCCFTKK